MTMRTIILAAGASAAWAASAVAEPMRFENPTGAGHIDWENFWIDITLPASEQIGVRTDSTARNSVSEGPHDPHASEVTVSSGLSPGFTMSFVKDFETVTLVPIEFGDLIGPGGQIPNGGASSFFSDTFIDGELVSSNLRFPLGRSFIGMDFRAFDADDTIVTHFGWMEVNLFQRPDGTHKVDALAWGYETEPETAVRAGIPTPAAVTPFVIAAAALGVRRRR